MKTMNLFRQTGRTSRMITAVLQHARKHPDDQITVWVAKGHEISAIQQRIQLHPEFRAEYEARINVAAVGPEYINSTAGSIQLLLSEKKPGVMYFIDHATFEDWFPGIVAGLHQWDETIRLEDPLAGLQN